MNVRMFKVNSLNENIPRIDVAAMAPCNVTCIDAWYFVEQSKRPNSILNSTWIWMRCALRSTESNNKTVHWTNLSVSSTMRTSHICNALPNGSHKTSFEQYFVLVLFCIQLKHTYKQICTVTSRSPTRTLGIRSFFWCALPVHVHILHIIASMNI